MAQRRRRSREPRPGDKYAIILEQMREQNRATIEAVLSVEASLGRRLDDLRRDLLLRIEALEVAVRTNSEHIRQNTQDVRQNTQDIQRMKEQLADLTQAVREKPTAAELRVLEARVAALEQRLKV